MTVKIPGTTSSTSSAITLSLDVLSNGSFKCEHILQTAFGGCSFHQCFVIAAREKLKEMPPVFEAS